MIHLWFYPFFVLFIVSGAGMSSWVLYGMLKGCAISQWPTVDATIQSCELKETHDSEGGNSYKVIVRYTYNVLGQEYENNAIHPSYASSSFDGHRPLYEQLKNAQVVRARYNEANPAEAYLVTGFYSAHLMAFFGGLLFMSAGIFFLLTFHFAIAGNSDYVSGLEVIR